jgi:hypothetical protein
MESQVDWLSVVGDDRAEGAQAAQMAWDLYAEERDEGCTEREFNVSGFSGKSCGRVHIGDRRGVELVQL